MEVNKKMSIGFVKLRRGLLEHLESGKMSASELACYIVVLLSADHTTGVWHGSAAAITDIFGESMPSRTARWSLAKLETNGYIRRDHLPGKRGNYAISVCKYDCRDVAVTTYGKQTGYDESGVMHCRGVASIQEIRINNNKKHYAEQAVFESQELRITAKQDAAWRSAFPWADLASEYAKMRAWIIANPKRAPRSNAARFAHNWLARIPRPAKVQRQAAGFDDEVDIPLADRPF